MRTGPRSLDDSLDWLRRHFDDDAARGADAVYQLELSGPGGGSFFAILDGRANPDLLLMEDRIEVKGDLSLALKLRRLFRPGEREPRPRDAGPA